MQQNILKINIIDEAAAIATLTGKAAPTPADETRQSLPAKEEAPRDNSNDLKASFHSQTNKTTAYENAPADEINESVTTQVVNEVSGDQ